MPSPDRFSLSNSNRNRTNDSLSPHQTRCRVSSVKPIIRFITSRKGCFPLNGSAKCYYEKKFFSNCNLCVILVCLLPQHIPFTNQTAASLDPALFSFCFSASLASTSSSNRNIIINAASKVFCVFFISI